MHASNVSDPDLRLSFQDVETDHVPLPIHQQEEGWVGNCVVGGGGGVRVVL